MFYSDDAADTSNVVAYRSLHTSKPAHLAAPPVADPTTGSQPITAVAQRGSNQLSLEQPQNKAGAFLPYYCV
jgi:NADH dehydrogenase (ubiquinone) Fe-S protein 7